MKLDQIQALKLQIWVKKYMIEHGLELGDPDVFARYVISIVRANFNIKRLQGYVESEMKPFLAPEKARDLAKELMEFIEKIR